MSASRIAAARPSRRRSDGARPRAAIIGGRPQRRTSTAPTRAWSMPSSRRSRRARSSGPRRGLERSRSRRARRAPACRRREAARRPRARRAAAAGDLGDPLGADPRRDGVAAEALVAARSQPGWLEEVVGLEPAGERGDAIGVELLDRLADAAGRGPDGPSPLLAARITAIASAVSASIASATSPGEAPGARSRPTRRRRASASAGSAVTASNASASRWPPTPRLGACGAACAWLSRLGLAHACRSRSRARTGAALTL